MSPTPFKRGAHRGAFLRPARFTLAARWLTRLDYGWLGGGQREAARLAESSNVTNVLGDSNCASSFSCAFVFLNAVSGASIPACRHFFSWPHLRAKLCHIGEGRLALANGPVRLLKPVQARTKQAVRDQQSGVSPWRPVGPCSSLEPRHLANAVTCRLILDA